MLYSPVELSENEDFSISDKDPEFIPDFWNESDSERDFDQDAARTKIEYAIVWKAFQGLVNLPGISGIILILPHYTWVTKIDLRFPYFYVSANYPRQKLFNSRAIDDCE